MCKHILRQKHDKSMSIMFLLSLLTGGNAVANVITTPQNAAVQQVTTCVGSIVDHVGEPVVGASVLVKGSMNGTISDVDGHFALTDYIAAYEEAGFSTQYWAGNGDISRWKELLQQYQTGTLQGVRENGIFAEGDKVYYLKEGNPSANALGTGFLNNHSISLSGGTDKVRFRLSGNYSTEDGPMLLIRTGISAR